MVTVPSQMGVHNLSLGLPSNNTPSKLQERERERERERGREREREREREGEGGRLDSMSTIVTTLHKHIYNLVQEIVSGN